MARGAPAHRSPSQRAVAARYDAWHALLVRAVHPICFGVFTLLAGVVVGIAALIAFEAASDDAAGVAFVVLILLGAAVLAAFTFVFTRPRAWITLALLATWSIGLWLYDDVDASIVWAIWGIAVVSIVIQVGMLAWVLPRRIRMGLVHLMVPATIGTVLGAVPVGLGMSALLRDDVDAAVQLARLAFIAAGAVVVALLALHEYGRWHEYAVMKAFATRHHLQLRKSEDSGDVNESALDAKVVSSWAVCAGPWNGKVHGRRVVLRSGYTSSRAPDVPSLHLTLLAMETKTRGRNLWVRRRSLTHDNLLVGSDHSEVVRFESIALDEGWNIRFAPGTDALDAYVTMGPELLEVLERGLGEAQVCRVGKAVTGWIIGGALDAEELDRLAATLDEVATLLEAADATLGGG